MIALKEREKVLELFNSATFDPRVPPPRDEPDMSLDDAIRIIQTHERARQVD